MKGFRLLACLAVLSNIAAATIAHATCSQLPAPPTYHCGAGLCDPSCPDGSISQLRACAESIYYTWFGYPHTFKNQETDTNDNVTLEWDGYWPNYQAFLVKVTPGTDCPEVERNLGGKQCLANGGPLMGNPVNASTGNKHQVEDDYAGVGPFPLTFRRYYNSAGNAENAIGKRWSHTFSGLLIRQSSTTVKLARADGEVLYFQKCGALWCAAPDIAGSLLQTEDANGGTTDWQFRDQSDVLEAYDGAGRLKSVTSRSGVVHALSYDRRGL